MNLKKENNEQAPLSNAFVSICSFAKSSKLITDEKNQNVMNYH
jgi:hypothetical protein